MLAPCTAHFPLVLTFEAVSPHSIMAPASATTQKPNDKAKKQTSQAPGTPKAESESPVSETNGTEPTYLKELQKCV